MSAVSSSKDNKENVPTAVRSGTRKKTARPTSRELQLLEENDRLKSRLEELEVPRATQAAKTKIFASSTGRETEWIDENGVVINAAGFTCPEYGPLKNSLTNRTVSSRSISCTSATPGVFNAYDFLAGCDVSSVIVAGNDKLDASWFCRYIAADSTGQVYIADETHHVVRRIDIDGSVTALGPHRSASSTFGRNEDLFNEPMGIGIGPDDTVYVSEWRNNAIRCMSADGLEDTTIASSERLPFAADTKRESRFYDPHGCAVGPDGTVYVADMSNHRILRVSPHGTVTTIGGSGEAGHEDGHGCYAQFNYPTSVAVDANSNVFVADWGNHVVRRIAPDGTVDTIAGSGPDHGGFKDGNEAKFEYPNDVAVGVDGAVYVADRGNSTVRCILPSGFVTTIAGTGSAGYKDGNAMDAMFSSPEGITIDPDGTIYVMDSANNRIRKITPQPRQKT
eukprot:GEMP01047171.1.p1 GENE.GEMP01047171.1~~GEMP01047171.1.p1  ORF type:complete len:450 (+),score=110.75 GEMP01047171.1:246-1595(+)